MTFAMFMRAKVLQGGRRLAVLPREDDQLYGRRPQDEGEEDGEDDRRSGSHDGFRDWRVTGEVTPVELAPLPAPDVAPAAVSASSSSGTSDSSSPATTPSVSAADPRGTLTASRLQGTAPWRLLVMGHPEISVPGDTDQCSIEI